MPLNMATIGEKYLVKKILGKDEIRRFLENLGFVPGVEITPVSEICGNVIVQVRESRVAVSKEMAGKIII